MNIAETFDWIYSLEEKRELLIIEEVTNFEDKRKVKKNNSGLHFSLSICNESSKLLFIKESRFIIKDDLFEIKIKHYLPETTNFKTQRAKCKAYIFESDKFNADNNQYFKYFSKIESHFLISDFINEYSKNINFTHNGIVFKISTCRLTENMTNSYLCIVANQKISFKDFKHYINCIINTIGFLSGYLYKKEEYFFQSEKEDFLDTNFFYRSQDKRLTTYQPFTKNPQSYNEFFDEKFKFNKSYKEKFSSSISEIQFQKLVELVYENPKYLSALRMIFGSNKNEAIVEHSVIMVVMEIITKEVRNKFHSEFIQKELVKEVALKILLKIKNKISKNDFEELKNAIECIEPSKAKNIIDFELAFSSLKINLTEKDKKSLKRRNNIFHGSVLKDYENVNTEEDYSHLENEYRHHSYKLYGLICKLILKQIDFNGHLLNHSKLYERNTNIVSGETYFTKI